MFLSRLYISEDAQVKFEKGLNIILAVNRKDQEAPDERISDTNGVGKSTIVNMVKFLLCGSTENYLESKFFSDNEIWPCLEILDELEDKPYVLTAPLNSNLKSKVYVVYAGNLEEFNVAFSNIKLGDVENLKTAKTVFSTDENFSVLNKDEYKSFLSRIENIDYSDVNLKLSSLMDYICRDEKLGFGDIVARVGRTTWIQYRAIQYLFGLPYKIEESSIRFREKISSLKNELEVKRNFLNEQDIHNLDSLEVKKIQYSEKLSEVQSEIGTLDLTNSNEESRVSYQKKKTELVRVNEEINYRESQLGNQLENLEELKLKEKAVDKILDAEKFLEDIIENFPDLLKENIANYHKFINSLATDRKDYHKNLIREIRKKIKVLEKEKVEIEKELASLSRFMSNTDMIIDISRLTAREEGFKLKLEMLKDAEKFLDECDGLEEDIENQKTEWQKTLKKGKDLQKNVSFRKFKNDMIKLFLGMVKTCYQANDGAIEFIYNDKIETSSAGRTEIACSLASDTSHGRTNAKICLFDFTWFLRPHFEGEFNPQFLIHDGPYSKISDHVKVRMLNMIDDLTKKSSKQYIITMNDSEVPDIEEFSSNVRITLDGKNEKGKFFGVQYE